MAQNPEVKVVSDLSEEIPAYPSLQPGAINYPSLSVVIAAYSMERWPYLQELVKSIQEQSIPPLETIVVVDHCPELLRRASEELNDVQVVPNTSNRGASGARNSGVRSSCGEIIAFLDDDTIACPSWAGELLQHFASSEVVGVGGQLVPLWSSSRPAWFPPEFDWTVGVSYRGMPEAAESVRNVWSSNMAIRRSAFDVIGGFRDDFGKVGTRSRPEDTDLCLRALAAEQWETWIYEPAALVNHRVPPERSVVRYFLIRCFNEGWGKALLAALDGAQESTSVERRYTREVLPAAVISGLRETIKGDLGGLLRSLAIIAGFTVTAVAFLAGRTALVPKRMHHGRLPGISEDKIVQS